MYLGLLKHITISNIWRWWYSLWVKDIYLIVFVGLLSLIRPVLTHRRRIIWGWRQHDQSVTVLFPYHLPELSDGGIDWCLSTDVSSVTRIVISLWMERRNLVNFVYILPIFISCVSSWSLLPGVTTIEILSRLRTLVRSVVGSFTLCCPSSG